MNTPAAGRLPGGMVARLIVLLGSATVLYAVLACSAQTPGTQTPVTAAPVYTTQSSATPSSTAQSSATPPASTQPSSSSSSPAQSSSATATSAASDAPELNTRTSQVPLQSHANLVPIRVVAHDASGHAVENLQKKDFEVKQDGKLQFITHFSVETPASMAGQVARGEAIPLPPDSTSHPITSSTTDATANAAGGANAGGKLALPTRFIALLFDDSHLDVGDLNRAKIAALKFIDVSVKPSERLAIFNFRPRASGFHRRPRENP